MVLLILLKMKREIANKMENTKAFKALVSKEKSNTLKNIKFRRKFRLLLRLKSKVILSWLWLFEREAKSNLVSFFNKPTWNWQFNISNVILTKLLYFDKSYELSMPHWKEKYSTPRCERIPFIRIMWLWFDLYIFRGSDEYWERYLWIHYFNNGNELNAIKTWSWTDGNDETKSTFNDWFSYYPDKCPKCNKGSLDIVKGLYPYNTNYKQCTKCDSTFNLT